MSSRPTSLTSSGPSGEVAVLERVEVPLAPGVDLEAIRRVDEDPCFVTVRIRAGAGQGGAGPVYGPAVMRAIGEQVNRERPAGYRGHQDADKVHFEWREPVTTWVGALWSEPDQSLYVKGYVLPTAGELRQQVRLAATGVDAVNSVSVFGTRRVNEALGEVESMDLWSIDWTPKGRAGMETELVAVTGEQQDDEDEEDEVDRAEVIASLVEGDLPPTLVLAIEQRARQAALDELVATMAAALGQPDADQDALVALAEGMTAAREAEELTARVEGLVEAGVAGEIQREAVVAHVTGRVQPDVTDEELAAEIEAAGEVGYIKALRKDPQPVNGGGSDGVATRRGTSWTT